VTLTYRDKHGQSHHQATHRDLTQGTWSFDLKDGELVLVAHSDRLPFVASPVRNDARQEAGLCQRARERLFRQDPEG